MGNDDERLEGYLRQFRPARPAPLPVGASTLRRVRRPFAWAAMAATVLIAVGTWLSVDHRSRLPAPKTRVDANEGAIAQPLTVSQANTMLFRSRSVADTLNRMAFSRKPRIPAGKWSVLGVFGEEKSKM